MWKIWISSALKKLEGFTKPVALISLNAVGWSQVSFLQKGHESPVHHSPHHSMSSVTPYGLPFSFVLSVTSLLAFEGCGFLCVCVCFACLFVFVFWPGSSQDLSSQARDRNRAPWTESWSPNHWITREVPNIWVLTSDLDAETLDLLWKNRERKKKAKSRMRKQRSWSQIIVHYQEPWTWVKRTQILLSKIWYESSSYLKASVSSSTK